MEVSAEAIGPTFGLPDVNGAKAVLRMDVSLAGSTVEAVIGLSA